MNDHILLRFSSKLEKKYHKIKMYRHIDQIGTRYDRDMLIYGNAMRKDLEGSLYSNYQPLPVNTEMVGINPISREYKGYSIKDDKVSHEEQSIESFKPSGCKVCVVDGVKLLPVLDPRFNLREVGKNLILLEDHLFHPDRRCLDCISKHMLTIEGFLDEAITLDKSYEYTGYILDLRGKFKDITRDFWSHHGIPEVYFITAQRLREIRKPLCVKYVNFC